MGLIDFFAIYCDFLRFFSVKSNCSLEKTVIRTVQINYVQWFSF